MSTSAQNRLFRLTPVNQLTLQTSSDGIDYYKMTGPDPFFRIDVGSDDLVSGYYELGLQLPQGTDSLREPVLYFEFEDGFSEDNKVQLHFLERGEYAIARFLIPQEARGLRFDPSTRVGIMAIGDAYLKPTDAEAVEELEKEYELWPSEQTADDTRYDLRLLPISDLSLKKRDGNTDFYDVTGNDSFFLAVFRKLALQPGYYELTLTLPLGPKSLRAPALFFDFGAGFHIAEKMNVNFIYHGEQAVTRFFIPREAVCLRFDPSTQPGVVALGEAYLKPIGEAVARNFEAEYLQWFAKALEGNQTGHEREMSAVFTRPYRHIGQYGYDLPNSVVSSWISSDVNFKLAYDLESDEDADRLMHWWLRSGRSLFPALSRFTDYKIIQDLHLNHLVECEKSTEFTPLLTLIHRNRPDLQSICPADNEEGRSRFWDWWHAFGAFEYKAMPGIAGDLELEASPSEAQTSPALQNTELAMVGYPKGEFGLGEDIRLLRTTLGTQGLDCDLIRAPWGIAAREAVNEVALDAELASFNVDTMIYVMPAFDTLTLFNKLGPKAFSARRKIGYWQWELSKFPRPPLMAFEIVDEIWCHSEHSARAFRGATTKPVIKVPLPVQVPSFSPAERKEFGLNDENFIIFTSFDGASSISRKNPLAAINAFQLAFPKDRYPDVNLVIKAMNTLSDGLWRDCIRKSYMDDRILIRNEVLDRDRYYQLLNCCDAVLSMHRAEGFGRLMAEAMALGIPCVATKYSGNLDFMNADNSWLVPGKTLPLIPGDYPFHEGQEWLEPDVEKASEALFDCYNNEEKRKRIIANARSTMDRYSPESCGNIYARLLQDG